MPDWLEAIPLVKPIPPCHGLLAHNTKSCHCYEQARAKAFKAELAAMNSNGPLWLMLGMFVAAPIVGLVVGSLSR